jgi:hypothetical protein
MATATDSEGNTSQFSDCIEPAANLPAPTLTVTSAADAGFGTLRQALLDAGVVPGTGAARIHFNIPGGGVKVIAPLEPLPSPSVRVEIDGYPGPRLISAPTATPFAG